MVFVGCGNGTTDDDTNYEDFSFTTLTLVTTIAAGGHEDLNAGDIAEGKGWIAGDDFTSVKDAPAGSILRVQITGSTNLDWTEIGAIGIGSFENSGNRLGFAPRRGTYFIQVLTRDIFALNGGATATNIGVNIWGGHVIDKVELGVPNTEQPPQDPRASDFNIIGETTQFEGSITNLTIEPKFGMSSGTITIYYEGISPTVYAKSTTVPSAIGSYRVTFDVAAADGFNAATGLDAGTFTIMGAPPFFWDNIVANVALGDTAITTQFQFGNTSLDDVKASKYFVIETLQPAAPDNANGFGGINFILNSKPGWSAGQTDNANGSFTAISRTPGSTIYIVFNLEEMNGYADLDEFVQINLQYWNVDNLVTVLGITNAYLVDNEMPLPTGRVDFSPAANGFVYKLP